MNSPPVRTSSPAGPSQPDTAPQLRVLVVDDSRMQRKIVTSALKKWGFDVLEADSGTSALKICAKTPVDLIISDWVMPGISGLEFCQEFRKIEQAGYVYFILLTSKAETAEIALGLDAGADDFLTKPVSFGELRARVKAGERILKMQSELISQNAVVSDTLAKLQTLHKAIDRDLQEARKLQQSLVKDAFVEHDGANVALCLQSCGHIGGDLVGQFTIDDDTIGVYSIDVSGHGVSSALMTARLSSYLSDGNPAQNIALVRNDKTYEARDPAETFALLNNILLSELDTELYFTMALATVSLKTGEGRCAQAGHPHPIIQCAGNSIRLMGEGGIPIGLIPDAEFESFEFQLQPGDRMFLYSDGITECENMGGQFLDEDGLIRIMKTNSKSSAPEFVTDLIWELQSFRGDRDQADDISGLVLDFKGR